jgi:hypothetical protein
MFRITVTTKVGPESQIASGPRRALARLREMRDTYGIEPEVTDGTRSYVEADLARMAQDRGE